MIKYKKTKEDVVWEIISPSKFITILSSKRTPTYAVQINDILWITDLNIQPLFVTAFKKELLWEKLKA